MDGGHAETCAAPSSDIHMQICSVNASRWGPLSIRLFASKRGGHEKGRRRRRFSPEASNDLR